MALLMPGLQILFNGGIIAVLWFGGNLAFAGDLTTGEVVAFVNYLLFTLVPVVMLGMIMPNLAAGGASAERIVEVLDVPPEVQDRPSALHIQDTRGHVVFEDVWFSYNGNPRQDAVLKGVTLTAKPGEMVAILGQTGSGKSSLVHLIPRFYDVTDGRLLLDGVDVRELTQDSLRAQVGVCLQESVLFRGTIRDNIRYGCPEASDGEVIAAARAAQAHWFIADLPDGYDTVLGQRGAGLSGGQKQRVAIARALLTQPSVLILDDSTSAVDVETEARIQDALDELMQETTFFVVAQRISTVLTADKIVVLDRGQVAAVGTHTELMESSPIYQDIYASQLGENNDE
jgi:ATP-binding cassette subfamily B protein